MTELEPRLSDEDAQKVLARALELQNQGARTLTVAQIRAIAAELAIPEPAVEQALWEYHTAAAVDLPATASTAATGGKRRGFGRILMLSTSVVGTVFILLLLVTLIMRG